MKKALLLAFALLTVFAACKKQNIKANFTVPKSSYYLTEVVSFSNQSENGKSYTWDFGDGQTSSDENPTHAYSKPGTFIVTLTAGKSTFTKNVKINIGTASYEINNQFTAGLEFVSFWANANNEIQNFTEHNVIAANGKSDTVYTSSPIIYVGVANSTAAYLVTPVFTINKFTHNKLIFNGSSRVIPLSLTYQAEVLKLRNPATQTTTFNNLPGIAQ
ncbi:PKD domain-containing protein [Mucilaginibacter terrae]|uniref:PKD domain-containing protein n=1 Tax=Mucilaginibacter terrae TaxID=1955052 RepID=UPI003632F5DE